MHPHHDWPAMADISHHERDMFGILELIGVDIHLEVTTETFRW